MGDVEELGAVVGSSLPGGDVGCGPGAEGRGVLPGGGPGIGVAPGGRASAPRLVEGSASGWAAVWAPAWALVAQRDRDMSGTVSGGG